MPELQSSWDMESEIKDMKTCHFIKKKKKPKSILFRFHKAETVCRAMWPITALATVRLKWENSAIDCQ